MADASGGSHSDPIPLEAFFGEGVQTNPVTEPLILEADLIVAVDIMSHREHVVYGRAVLRRIAESGEAEDVRILRIGIDSATHDLERLCALIHALRGQHDCAND